MPVIVQHRHGKIATMGLLTIDSSGPRTGLLNGQHVRDGGLDWTAELVRAATVTAGLRARVRASAQSATDGWSIEVQVYGRPLVLVDVDADGTDSASLDRLELRASGLWRDLTRDAALFEPRPWIGAIRISHAGEPEADRVERLDQLIAGRLLDVACVVMVDEADERVWSPSPATSLDAFQAALVGRCLYLATIRHRT